MKTQIIMKANGFPTLYGYACGYGKDYTRQDGVWISLRPFCNGLEVKGGGSWDQFFYEDYPTRAKAAQAAEREFERRCNQSYTEEA